METTRRKPGERQTSRLADREARLKKELIALNEARVVVREKTTGKTRAIAYCRKWLAALTDAELKHEAELRMLHWANLDSIEEIEEAILAEMFCIKDRLAMDLKPSTNGHEPADDPMGEPTPV